MMYYGHRQPVETDIDGFIPSENAEGYNEGIKILLDLPDYSESVSISKFTEAQIIQNLGRRIYKRVLSAQRKRSPEMQVKRFSPDLNYLEIDNLLSATGNLNNWSGFTLLSHEWDFTGTPGATVAPDLYDPVTTPVYQLGYYDHLNSHFIYEGTQYTTSPTGIQVPWVSGDSWEGIAAKIEHDNPVQIFEFDVRISSTDTNSFIRFMIYENEDFSGGYITFFDISPVLLMPHWKSILRFGSADTQFHNQDQWYRIKIINNTLDNKIYFYLDDVLIGDIYTDKLAKSFMISSWLKASGNLYFDTLKYYQSYSKTTEAKYTIYGDWINMAYALQGNLKRFWDCTQYDLKLLEPISAGQSHFIVDNRNYREAFQGHERIFILANNKLYGRKISSIQINPLNPAQEQFNFSLEFHDDIPLSAISRAGYARYSVLSGDIGFDFLSAEQYQATISFSELDVAEYEELT